MTLLPAPPGNGIRFRRRDMPTGAADVVVGQAEIMQNLAQEPVLANRHGTEVGGLRSLMASLTAAGVDNLVVELDGPEVPAMDGSAAPFLRLIECAGLLAQPLPRRHLRLTRSLAVEQGGGWARLGAAADRDPQIALSDDRPGPRRTIHHVLCMSEFSGEIAAARRSCFSEEIAKWREHGGARGASRDNMIVIEGTLSASFAADRFSALRMRRMLVEFIGDLALLGVPIFADLSTHRYDISLGIAVLGRLRTMLAEISASPVGFSDVAADVG